MPSSGADYEKILRTGDVSPCPQKGQVVGSEQGCAGVEYQGNDKSTGRVDVDGVCVCAFQGERLGK